MARYQYQDPQLRPRGMGHHALRRTLPLFKPYGWKLLAAGLFVTFTAAMVAVMPLFTKAVIDHLERGAVPAALRRWFAGGETSLTYVIVVMALFMAAMALRMLSWYAGQCILLFLREKVLFKIRSLTFTRLQQLCLRFHARFSPGYLYDRTLGGAATAVGTFLTAFFNQLIVYLSVIVFSLIICFRLHAGLTWWILAMSVGYVLISRYYGKRIHAITKDVNLRMNHFAGKMTDLLRGIKTIKAFAMEPRVISEFDEQLWPIQLRTLELNKTTQRMGFASESLNYLITAFIIVGGAYLVLRGHIGLGTMVAFIGYQGSLIGMFAAISNVWAVYAAAIAGLEQIYEVLDERPTVVEKPGARMPEAISGTLVFDDVHFRYDDIPVINGITLKVEPGQSVALVGPSGSGKTTLINLLLRFYDPDSGAVRLDGRDIRELPLTGYRNLFGVVLQEPFLFNDSIYHNMLAVQPDATEDEIRDALQRAQAWEFVQSLKDGWHFVVGEGGSGLSGGQRQRIALARCFLSNPRVMILDEATSALDNQSEWLVQQALQGVMQGRTTFIIAHRLSTVRHVDRILVLHEGRVVQDGDYPTLVDTPGLFRDLHLAALATVEESADETEV